FFQAEDGIRDPLVTGVQTCALPISLNLALRAIPELVPDRREDQPVQQPCSAARAEDQFLLLDVGNVGPQHPQDAGTDAIEAGIRSEEHTSELQSRVDLVCRLLLEKK